MLSWKPSQETFTSVADPVVANARFFYASSACIYPENRQLNTEIEGGGLKEEHAWPAQVMPGNGILFRGIANLHELFLDLVSSMNDKDMTFLGTLHALISLGPE